MSFSCIHATYSIDARGISGGHAGEHLPLDVCSATEDDSKCYFTFLDKDKMICNFRRRRNTISEELIAKTEEMDITKEPLEEQSKENAGVVEEEEELGEKMEIDLPDVDNEESEMKPEKKVEEQTEKEKDGREEELVEEHHFEIYPCMCDPEDCPLCAHYR